MGDAIRSGGVRATSQRIWLVGTVLLGMVLAGPMARADDVCQTVWTVLGSGTNGTVRAIAAFDDGTGPALYIGGDFSQAGGQAASNIAKWDGSTWSPLGAGTNARVNALAVFDDGTGPALYAGGEFGGAGGITAFRVARWNGSQWSSLGSGLTGFTVRDLAVFDDGSGPALYATGQFQTAGGQPVRNIAKWNGAAWSPLAGPIGEGLDGDPVSLAVFNDGSGPALYVGGLFRTAGGQMVSNIARWNGSTWSPVGSGVNSYTRALAVFDDGSGSALFAGGAFTTAGGQPVKYIARWDGSAWSPLAGPLDEGTNQFVQSLAVFDDGRGPALYVGGSFTQAGGQAAARIARWDGSAWSPVSSGMNGPVSALGVFGDGSGEMLCAGGTFSQAGGQDAHNISAYRASIGTWAPVGSGANDAIRVFRRADLGSGEELFIGGEFTSMLGQSLHGIARYDGQQISPLGAGLGAAGSSVHAFVMHDDGSGPAIYVGGTFTQAGGGPGNYIARWDGSQWSSLGSGTNNTVLALASVDHGSGPVLYAGGLFTQAGGQPANRIARWNGSAWETVAGGACSNVRAMAVIGPNLIIGDDFTHVGGSGCFGGVDANHIARFNGTAWSTLGNGTNGSVYSLLVQANESGTTLFAGGGFTVAGSVSANRVARWNGSVWSRVGAGFDGGIVQSLALLDLGLDGNPIAIALGSFTHSGGRTVNHIARWDGQSWRGLRHGSHGAVGVNPGGTALSVTDFGGNGESITVGGFFTQAGGQTAARIARWRLCDFIPPCPPDLNGDGSLTIFDFLEFQNLFAAGDMRADFDGDGTLTIFDFLAFQNAFAIGCP
ncbi:MAG: hypothetical protein KIT54_09345 [Phycisphaeraceae bacterium]|nr:hypothetical protein [Phycisphaeraceae bacterium]